MESQEWMGDPAFGDIRTKDGSLTNKPLKKNHTIANYPKASEGGAQGWLPKRKEQRCLLPMDGMKFKLRHGKYGRVAERSWGGRHLEQRKHQEKGQALRTIWRVISSQGAENGGGRCVGFILRAVGSSGRLLRKEVAL